ncbi:MAG: hypothetical protein ACPG8W_13625 [Candidatus Promineifilaceae bacterium]
MPLSFNSTVHPIDFSKLSGHEFERLVFAVLLRMYSWHTLDWFGQTGSDGGRDIIGTRHNYYGNEETVVIACGNLQKFASTKGTSDIDSLVKASDKLPTEVIIVAGGPVSAGIKTKCQDHAKDKKIYQCQVWSGSEFEEFLRFHASSVLERFFHGEKLPDDSGELRKFVAKLNPTTRKETANLLKRLFDRAAFKDPVRTESSLPAFKQAINDTINALNTGIWRDREGAQISRIPSRHDIPDTKVQDELAECVDYLRRLRIAFDDGLRNRTIKPCGCNQLDCPVYIIEPEAIIVLEEVRTEAINSLNAAASQLQAYSG